jgi:acylphosphatase
MSDNVRVHVIISGRVQGVFFRMETQRAARRLGVAGWVRNLPDGTVEAVLEGSRGQVDAMLDWCRQGPPSARVDDLRIEEQPAAGASEGFEVRF